MAQNPVVTTVSACRTCGGTDWKLLHRIQPSPVAGVYLKTAGSEEWIAPLTFLRCSRCSLVQLEESLSERFYQQYHFSGGVAEGYRKHLTWFADSLLKLYGKRIRVLEIGCGDGTLLHLFQERGCEAWGFEPSKTLANATAQKKVPVIDRVFNRHTFKAAHLEPFNVVVIRHVLEHLNHFEDIFSGLELAAAPSAKVMIEVPDLLSAIRHHGYGNFYHSHCCYFDLSSLNALLGHYGWRIVQHRTVPVFGGSLLVHAEVGKPTLALPPTSPTALSQFFKQWEDYRWRMLQFFEELAQASTRTFGFGASERTGALIGLTGLTRRHVQGLFDNNKSLEGLFLAGSGIPILSPARLAEVSPQAVALFAQSFEGEIIAKYRSSLPLGSHFISLKGATPRLLSV